MLAWLFSARPWRPQTQQQGRDWSALPSGVLQRIFHLASTWQAPMSCTAACVCSNWRSAAAGCRGIRLLHQVGPVDSKGRCTFAESLTAWLGCNSPQLEALTLIISPAVSAIGWRSIRKAAQVLSALADAAEAAQAAGAPLALHTLRVLGGNVEVRLIGRLVAALPNLQCLQLSMSSSGRDPACPAVYMRQALAPLKQATQLQQLYLGESANINGTAATMAALLPLTLQRLSWQPPSGGAAPNLAHLSQLTFLQLSETWQAEMVTSDRLPPGLQALELDRVQQLLPEEHHQELLTGWDMATSGPGLEHVPLLVNTKTASMDTALLLKPAMRAAIGQLRQLSTLKVYKLPGCLWWGTRGHVERVVDTASSCRNLRSLHLTMSPVDPLTELVLLPGLTRLEIRLASLDFQGLPMTAPASLSGSCCWPWMRGRVRPVFRTKPVQCRRVWEDICPIRDLAFTLSCMVGLKWLSVPGLLVAAGWSWLECLKQLQVLELTSEHPRSDAWGHLRVEELSPHSLPPQLQLLAISRDAAEAVTGVQGRNAQRRRLQQQLGTSECEVVVGVDLQQVVDPTQQLAGLPVALQQALG